MFNIHFNEDIFLNSVEYSKKHKNICKQRKDGGVVEVDGEIVDAPISMMIVKNDDGNGVRILTGDGKTMRNNLLEGIYAEMVVDNLFNEQFEKMDCEKWDCGIDLVPSGHSIDVKCKGRNAQICEKNPRSLEWAVNVSSLQVKDWYKNDYYIFCSLDLTTWTLQVIALVPKAEYLKIAHLQEGDAVADNGKKCRHRDAAQYTCMVKELKDYSFDSIAEMQDYLRSRC